MGKKDKKQKKKLKGWYIVIIAIVILIISSSGGNTEPESASTNEQVTMTPKPTSTLKPTATPKPTSTPKPTATPKLTVEDYINGIVDAYNSQEAEQLVFDEDFTPSDENSGHYRSEFRLTAFKDAIGKSYRLGENCVDIVSNETYSGKVNIRVYASGVTLDQVITLVQRMSMLLDETLSESEIEEVIQKIETDKEANGYYYGKLGIVLTGKYSKSYNLMIKKE